MSEEKELLLRDLYYSYAKKGTFLTRDQLIEKSRPYHISVILVF